jgi:hypothetical protein
MQHKRQLDGSAQQPQGCSANGAEGTVPPMSGLGQEGHEVRPQNPSALPLNPNRSLADEDIDHLIESEGYLTEVQTLRKEVKATAVPGMSSKRARQVPFGHLCAPSPVPSLWVQFERCEVLEALRILLGLRSSDSRST